MIIACVQKTSQIHFGATPAGLLIVSMAAEAIDPNTSTCVYKHWCYSYLGSNVRHSQYRRLPNLYCYTVMDLKRVRGTSPPWGQIQILSISCSFWEILAKSHVGAPRGVLATRGNPGSATGIEDEYESLRICFRSG